MNLDKQILEELEKFKLMSSYSPKKTLSENINEQATPGGVKQAAIDKILVFSKSNKSKGKGSYLFSPQQSEIDREFGTGTYDKFFNNGGKDILDNKKIEPKQKSGKPEVEIPSGVSKEAVDKILVFSNNNKSRQRGSYLFPPQQSEIDREFGAGTYNKFFNGGGKDILDGNKILKTSVGNTDSKKPAPKPVPIPKELGDIEGVKKFQDWLDKNHAGWATGFSGGVLNKAGGYGRFGPRTSKAWSSYGSEYQKSLTGATTPPTNPNDVASIENKFGLKSSADIVADYKKNNTNIPNPNGVNPQDMAKNS